jgi:hypothetical protein
LTSTDESADGVWVDVEGGGDLVDGEERLVERVLRPGLTQWGSWMTGANCAFELGLEDSTSLSVRDHRARRMRMKRAARMVMPVTSRMNEVIGVRVWVGWGRVGSRGCE